MKAIRLAAAMGEISALLAMAPASAQTQQVPVGGVLSPPIQQPGSGSLYPGRGSLYPTPIPPQGGMRSSHHSFQGGFHRGLDHGFNGRSVFYEEPEVVHDVVVVHDEPAEPRSPPPPSPPREPYVLGRIYGSLPSGCMKMIESGASFFHCSGEWYRQVGAQYKAVVMP